MTNKYTAAVIGLSDIASVRSVAPSGMTWFAPMPRSHVAAYEAHPRITLAGVCDLLPSAIERFNQTWRDALPDTRTYSDYREMIEREKPDILSVVTPDDKHADIVVHAANSGVKGIYCEKPLATSLADADRMLAACEANGVFISVNHTRRYAPVFVQVREMLRAGTYGKLRHIYALMHQPRSMLFRNGAHWIDMLCFWADAAPEWVMAELEEGFAHFDAYRADGGRDAALDPSASAYVHFKNGVRAFLSLAKVSSARTEFTLVCDDAMIDVTNSTITIVRGPTPLSWSSEQIVTYDFQHAWEFGAVHEMVHLLDHEGAPLAAEPLSSGRTARDTVAVMMAILESHKRGNVRVPVM
jgi:predicted dehydrogenase